MRRTSGSTHAPGEEDTWYDDVRAHREPAVETARHLASQVVRLRREAHQPRLSTAEKQTRECVAVRPALPTHQSTSGQRGLSSEGSADAARETRRKEERWPVAVATVLLSAHEIGGGGVGKPSTAFPIPPGGGEWAGRDGSVVPSEREGEGRRMKRPFAECMAVIGASLFAFLLFLFQLIDAALLLVPPFGQMCLWPGPSVT
ncbi:hypothetical protein TcYC6_0021390 [Trypanosoma cruzi]|nr:hypothetical protein TcYC6_0021390 [Trypanosoma cruzi]